MPDALAAFFEAVYAMRWFIIFTGTVIGVTSLVAYQAAQIRQLRAELAEARQIRLIALRKSLGARRGTTPAYGVFDETTRGGS